MLKQPGSLTLFSAALTALMCVGSGCSDPMIASSQIPATGGNRAQPLPFDPEAVRPQVVSFCGACHGLPSPEAFAKEKWPEEVAKAYEFYRASGRFDLEAPRLSSVVSYYQSLAPEVVKFEEPLRATAPLAVEFRPQTIARPPGASASAVAFLRWEPPREDKGGRLLVSDMHAGVVYEIPLPADEQTATWFADLGHPAIIEPSDLDADGRTDYLVGDLGTFLPGDHDQGRVLWLDAHRQKRNGDFEVLAEGLGRVSQAVSGDFDGDGHQDVLVAEFGWRKTGRILLLRGQDRAENSRHYTLRVIDPRHGASHVQPLDWDRDGDLDFVALISQEHEKLELFRNDGTGSFQAETIYSAGDPSFGFSGFELVDFDADGDLDLLVTNGDSMDSDTLKPSHAVRWLENAGSFPWTMHRLSVLPGAYKAVAGDFDGDGDLDVAALAFPPMGTSQDSQSRQDLLVVLERIGPGEFRQHVLPDRIGGAALAAADFDGDGDLDLASGAFHQGPDETWVTVWWNEGKK